MVVEEARVGGQAIPEEGVGGGGGVGVEGKSPVEEEGVMVEKDGGRT